MARKKKKAGFTNTLIFILLLSAIATLILRMANQRLQIAELGELAGYAGTIFVIALLLLVGGFLIRHFRS
jgi:nitrate/nitrite transporter NarK